MSQALVTVLRPTGRLLVRSIQGFLADSCSQMAAAISYYVLFSVFPLLIFTAALFGLLLADDSTQRDLVNEVMNTLPLDPVEGRQSVTEAVSGVAGSSGGVLGVVGLLGMVWSGSAMFGAVRKSLDSVSGDRTSSRPLIQQRLMDLGLALAVGAIFLCSVAFTALLRVVRSSSEEVSRWTAMADGIGILWDVGSYALPMLLSFVAFAAVYSVVPSRSRPLGEVWPGALVAAVLFDASKVAFSVYVENFSNYNVVFGSLGAVAAFLAWIYLSSSVMLFGAEFNAKRMASRSPDESELTKPQFMAPRRTFLRSLRGLFLRN